ncbi:Glycosyl transferase family 2 [Pseudomonas peli]|uniref:Glycosyl transferase family 2 n=1 Tax=Pseudomonas peli TaxID=592361 RepID=A0AB37Z4D6_9PSED|nr:glycosyltransferase [Pseudomonas peli]SCW34038.1 Glycosyl transferase family 2 [Pseudomonas peli]
MRKLFSKRPHPYYIYAPDYRRTSAGVRVMHMLCDALMRTGHEAYVTASVLNPELMTPQLTDGVVKLHRTQGLEPITVYPEIVEGNPLNAGVVARYLLNRPGFIEGSGKFGEEDILFAYSRDLLIPGIPDDRVMMLPPFDLTVFRLPENPEKRVSGKVCYYRGRRGDLYIDPSLLPPDAVEITAQWPVSWEEMADLFQQCETFYCCGSSALGAEAALCGCLCVVILEEGAPRIGVHETQSDGVAWGVAPEELERARSTLPQVRDNWLRLEAEFWPALDHFIEVTQAASKERAGNTGKYELLRWLGERIPSKAQHELISRRLETVANPVFGVLILDVEGSNERLVRTVSSLGLEHSLYASVRILALTTALVPQTSAEDKLHFIRFDGRDHIEAINQIIEQSSFDWLMLVNAGDEFTPSGLLIAALDLLGAPALRAVYGDEVIRQAGGGLGIALRPDLNLDMLLSLPAGMSRHWLFKRDVWLDMGGFRAEAGEAFELDYILRLIEAQGFNGLGHISEPLLICNALNLKDSPDERATIQRHLLARGFQDARLGSRLSGCYDLDYGVASNALVSILVLVKGALGKVQRCLESVLERTSYPHYEVLLLDQGNDDPVLLEWLAGLEQLGTEHIRVLRFADIPASQVRNQAAELARGEFLLWLDSGIAVFEAEWLQQLLNHAARPEVGAVGAKLLGGDRSVRQAGLVLGLGGVAGPAFIGLSPDAPGYLQRLQIDQNYTALGGQCLMLRKQLFIEAGGFEQSSDLARWADVDLCLRLHEAGYLNVWTPRVELLINEEELPPASVKEEDAMYARWLPQLACDPAYNPNLSLSDASGFKLAESPLSWRPLSSWKPLPTVLAHAADAMGCGHYRVIQPLGALNRAGLADGVLSDRFLTVAELERFRPDAIVLQRQISDAQIEQIRRIKSFSAAFKVFELDDYLPNLPMKSAHRAHMPKDITRSLRRGLSYVNRFVVSTEPLAEAYYGLHDDIRVVHNRLDPQWWRGLSSQRRSSKKPRVGWAGGVSHTGDLEMISDVVKALVDEVEWVFFGMCPDKLRPYVHEFHPGIAIDKYPAALARMNLDLALAPVEQNLFNECKSNLRLLEYGACGFPVVCSDLVCYQGALPVTRVKNRFKDWVDAIRMHISDLDASAKMGDDLRKQVQDSWMLEGINLEAWRTSWLPD